MLAADAAERKSSAIKERDDKGRAAPTGSKLDPVEREATKTRKAAAIGTGYSGSTLDKVDKIRDIAELRFRQRHGGIGLGRVGGPSGIGQSGTYPGDRPRQASDQAKHNPLRAVLSDYQRVSHVQVRAGGCPN